MRHPSGRCLPTTTTSPSTEVPRRCPVCLREDKGIALTNWEGASDWRVEDMCEAHAAWYWGEKRALMEALVAESFGKPGKR